MGEWRKGKKPSRAIDEFEHDLVSSLAEITLQLQTKTYKHAGYRKLQIVEKKRRDLAVASVADRLVDRMVHDQLVEIYDKSFDPDVWSSRLEKGLHKCLARTQKLLQKYPDSYIWRSDITKFFDSVDQAVLIQILKIKIDDKSDLFWLCREIITSYNLLERRTENGERRTENGERRTGIPIGNVTSQVFANIYLNEFDRFVRHQLKPFAYIRYGDDFIVFASTKRRAEEYRAKSKNFLGEFLKLSLHKKNDAIVPSESGLKFLGHAITKDFCVVDKATSRAALKRVTPKNLASYKSLKLTKGIEAKLDHKILEILLAKDC